jgi:flagellar biosynthetic protein FlhB
METEQQDKQHAASSKRLDELRREGTVLRSRDLMSGLVFIVAIFQVIYLSSNFKARLQENFLFSFNSIKQVVNNHMALSDVIKQVVVGNFMLLLPIFCIMFIAVMMSPFLFGGWNFTLEVLGFKLKKLNPINNLKNTFSLSRILTDMVKSMVKATFLIIVLISFFLAQKKNIVSLVNLPVKASIHVSYSIIISFVMYLTGSIVVLVFFDVLQHYFQFQKKSKMSTQELKEEHKSSEVSSEVKRKIRSAQLALLKQRLSLSVPQATVIITNPTHYAIALRYDERKDRAPKMLAKGKDIMAQQIRYLGISNTIPIYEAPALARAIFHTTKLNHEIHPALYMPVAIVLSYIQQLKSYQSGQGQAPKYVNELEIPEEFIFHE